MSKSVTNPLAKDSKREKSGSDTLKKYHYQYHWAFCRMIDLLADGSAFVLFMEEHEDVTVSSSLSVETATFELNQVKEVGKAYTLNSLVKRKNGASVIGKLAVGTTGKAFTKKISSVNLVCTGGFSFDICKSYKLEKISAGDLTESEAKKIRAEILASTGDDILYPKIAFVLPDLPARDFENAVKGRIATLIDSLYPGCSSNSTSVYRCVIEDLYRKGQNYFDYFEWGEAVRKKGISDQQLLTIIEKHVHRKADSSVRLDVSNILDKDFNITSIQKLNVLQAFDRYGTTKFGDRSLSCMALSKEITELISLHVESCVTVKELFEKVSRDISKQNRLAFASDADLLGAVLYELLASNQ